MAESVEPLESFKDCWTAFRRQATGMMTRPCTPEESQELLKSRDALLLRLRRLRKSEDGESMPPAIGLALEQLQGYSSFASLSDARMTQLSELVKDAEGRISAWYAGIERKTVYQVSVAKRENQERTKRILIAAAAFVGLAALMSAATIQIYLNRNV